MKRLWRLFFNVLAVLLVLLCVPICALWWRSQSRYDVFTLVRIIAAPPPLALERNGVPLEVNETRLIFQTIHGRFYLLRMINNEFNDGTLKLNQWAASHSEEGLDWVAISDKFHAGFEPQLRFGNFALYSELLPPETPRGCQYLCAPLWALVFACCIPSLFVAGHQLRQKRRRARELAGFCGRCAYDLRATPDRCPECGNVPLKTL